MNRRLTLLGGLLAAALWGLASSGVYSAGDEPDPQAIKDAQKSVLELADAVAGGKNDLPDRAAAARKKLEDLKPVMYVFKPRKAKGVGIGAKGDGIEPKLESLGKRALSADQMKAQQDDLVRAGQITRAVAELTDLYPPSKNAAQWKKFTRDMQKGADGFIEAARGGDPQKVKKAAAALGESCIDCHKVFRND